jgi:BON domain
VKSRRFQMLAAAVSLWLAQTAPGFAGQPPRLAITPGQPLQATGPVSANQQLADTIAGQLRMSGQLRNYNVNIRADGGVVELTGLVAHQTQREEVLRIVMGVPGVDRVRDFMEFAATPASSPDPFAGAGIISANTQTVVPEPRPLPGSEGFMPAPPGAASNEPLPIFRAGPMGGLGAPPPPMPPYAWPTYAPYNNYSRVAYPETYPTQAFPYIGPMNPYPKVPLGWRSVQLKWEDGHWWFGRVPCGHDWWRVRYW